MDDERKDAEDKKNRKETAPSRSVEEPPKTTTSNNPEEPAADLNLSLEKILKMESIPGLPVCKIAKLTLTYFSLKCVSF